MQSNWEKFDPAWVTDHDPKYLTAIRQRGYLPGADPAPPDPKEHIAV
jgi:hypothetical protein